MTAVVEVREDSDLMLWSRAKSALRARVRRLGADLELRRRSGSTWLWFATWPDGRRAPVYLGGDLGQAAVTVRKIEQAVGGAR